MQAKIGSLDLITEALVAEVNLRASRREGNPEIVEELETCEELHSEPSQANGA